MRTIGAAIAFARSRRRGFALDRAAAPR